MKRKKFSLFAVLVLALSLALSPVSAFAEELDTPVHEDPIDEIVYGIDTINGHFTLYDGPYTTVFDVSVYCAYAWTEGISGQMLSATYTVTGIKINGSSASISYQSPVSYGSHNTWGKASKVYAFDNSVGYAVVDIMVFCDEYGDLSINAIIA